MNTLRRTNQVKLALRFAILLGTLFLSTMACDIGKPTGPERNAIIVDVVANTSLRAWLQSTVEAFNEADYETNAGLPIYVEVKFVESGQAIVNMTADDMVPAIWIPDEGVWVDLLADQGLPAFSDDCQSVAESPLVIAMWKPIAEALGWPGRDLGWLDVGSLAADPSAWDYYSGGQYGDNLRLGHTHPGLSATGAGTLLALVQAAQSKTDAVQSDEVELPIVQASVGAFEAAVSWFSSSTDDLGKAMRARGSDFLGASIVYESTVYEYGSGNIEIVPIYPLEGTFVATYPACIHGNLTPELSQAAASFRAYLLSDEGQQLALEHGFRSVQSTGSSEWPLSQNANFNIDLPGLVFEEPNVESIYAAQSLWQSARKDVNLVMLVDISGSMRGDKLASVQDAAIRFLEQMGDDDYISIIAFANGTYLVMNHEQIKFGRDRAIEAIQSLQAGGNTPLYDAIGDGAMLIDQHSSSLLSNALVVLTDGMDTGSERYQFDDELIDQAISNNTTVFTIAYGEDADEKILESLALQANGNFYVGDEASIVLIYEEMSAAFGGSVGVGR